MPSPSFMQHTFGGNPLDRADAKRRDENWLSAAYKQDNARILPFWRQRVLLNQELEADLSSLGWCQAAELASLEHQGDPIFLGLSDGVPHYAVSIAGKDSPAVATERNEPGTFIDCRAAAMALQADQSGIVAQAKAQLEWHRRNRFCGNCGKPTRVARGGHLLVCDECNTRKFPRTDPVVIMLLSRGDKCLLGQPNGPIAGSGFYTSLAGFVDQGESIEEAVRRETLEEAGIPVGKVHYHSSQPWPFPHTLMIGCHGEALSEKIQMDVDEMADVRWFDREEIRAVLSEQRQLPAANQLPPKPDRSSSNGEPPPVRVPGPMAIAHHLITAWAEGQPGTQF